ncbi:MAG: DUF4230 domain-containing protein [Tepidiformaceae bacterium]
MTNREPVTINVVGQSPGRSPLRAAGWLLVASAVVVLIYGGWVGWRWVNDNLFSLGVEDAGQVTVDRAQLLASVRAFELVTVKNTYDSSSHTAFKKRLNAGFTKIPLPGWVAGEELDVKAKVVVAAGVDLQQVTASDIEVLREGPDPVVVIRIPEATILSTEIDAQSFNISTGSGLLTKVGQTVGINRGDDIRDGSVASVVSAAQKQAIEDQILPQATEEARAKLQAFLQALPQAGGGSHVLYLVEIQHAPAR